MARHRLHPPRRFRQLYDVKTQVFTALIDAIDITQLASMEPETAREEIRDVVTEIIALKNLAMSIADQEMILDDICNDVMGLARWNRFWPAMTSPTSWSTAPTRSSSKSKARFS
jgi:hypothetical protein